MIYELASHEIIFEVEAHKNEIWELAMHTNP